jgi:hypothetical protein
MTGVVGIFTDRGAAERAVAALRAAGLPRDRISAVFPGHGSLAGVPTTEAEPPGMGPALGGVVGGAAGAATGVQVGALVGMVVPGVGPVLALGLLGAAVLGAAGVAAGKALNSALTEGLPRDEVFLYEDALRQGRSLVIALPADEEQAGAARRILAEAGAESLDAAREQWWVGLREAERAVYTAAGGDFTRDEADYRAGFEAALTLGGEKRTFDDAINDIRVRYPEASTREAFRRGWERGREWVSRHRSTSRHAA